MAIAMALNGGLGLIHYTCPSASTLSESVGVKNPRFTLYPLIGTDQATPEQSIGDILDLIEKKHFAFSTFRSWIAAGNSPACCPATWSNLVTPKRKNR